MSSPLGKEIAEAALWELGKPAIFHWQFAGDCISYEETLPVCMEVGLGPDEFDCSGLVISSICKVAGVETETWPAELRHVRQMWQSADVAAQSTFTKPDDEIGIGDLVIQDRWYRLSEGQGITVPGHVGVVVDVDDREMLMVHSAARAGKVTIQRLNDAAVGFASFIRVADLPV